MSNTDVEMEDTENLPNDTGDSFQGSEIKVLDEKSEIKLEKCLAAASAAAGDATNCVNGGEDSVALTNKETDESIDKSNIEPQVITESEAVVDVQNEIISEKKDQINTQDNPEEQIHTKSVMEEQTDARTGLVEHNASNGSLGEKNPPATDAVDGNHVENMMEESPNKGIVKQTQHEFDEEDGDCVEHVSMEEENMESAAAGNNHKDMELPSDTADNVALSKPNGALDEVPQVDVKEKEDSTCDTLHEAVKTELNVQDKEMVPVESITDGNSESTQCAAKYEAYDYSLPNNGEAATPHSVVAYSPSMAGQHSVQKVSMITQATLPLMAEGDDGTAEDQAAFMKELDIFHRERALDFKPPKFYGQQLNCLKLWRSVVRLGGYERVTGSKLWRQVGESFHPPKTCTTVSWTFRIFYEKSLLEYEKYKRQTGELQFPVINPSEASGVDKEANGYQGSEPGRSRRDAASRAMQGYHVQRLFNGEVVEPVMKDKNLNTTPKREKTLKTVGLGSLKQKRPNELENSSKIARIEMSKQLVASVVDIGPPADWVKINVRQTNECFEVYALVPGLLREEVRVQSDPAGRLVITGQPEQVDNPWGITPFKKVVSLPERIDPLRTSAVVSLHGRLLVRVPFAQPEN